MSLDAQRQNVTGLKGRALQTPCPNHDSFLFSMTKHASKGYLVTEWIGHGYKWNATVT